MKQKNLGKILLFLAVVGVAVPVVASRSLKYYELVLAIDQGGSFVVPKDMNLNALKLGPTEDTPLIYAIKKLANESDDQESLKKEGVWFGASSLIWLLSLRWAYGKRHVLLDKMDKFVESFEAEGQPRQNDSNTKGADAQGQSGDGRGKVAEPKVERPGADAGQTEGTQITTPATTGRAVKNLNMQAQRKGDTSYFGVLKNTMIGVTLSMVIYNALVIAYNHGKTFFQTLYRRWDIRSSRLAIVNQLIDHPGIDLLLRNNERNSEFPQGKTALDVVNELQKTVTSAQANALLRDVESRLRIRLVK